MTEAVIVSAVRTPVGKIRGALAHLQADQIAGIAIREAVKRAGIAPEEVDDVFYGNCRNIDVCTIARVSAREGGLPLSVPGMVVERGCGSALCAIEMAAAMIRAGEGDIYVAGGTESCTWEPCLMKRPQKYLSGLPEFFEGRMNPLNASELSMGETAEVVAERFNITREECDAFALTSQNRAAEAWADGRFDSQIIPIEVPGEKKGTTRIFNKDETVRESSMEALGRLRPSFRKDGVCTAGNSSPLTDGASALVIMNKDLALSRGIKPLAVIRGFASAALDPDVMGLGPVYSTRKLLAKMNMTLDDIDLIELNEAFAPQSVACVRELGLDMEKVNVNGGAIALGHPFGATGGILTTKMIYELERRNLKTGLITFCIGGGQGVAMLIERC